MLILRLWNYFRGYVIIRIEGLNLEKFINHCIAKDIYLWDIRRLSYTTLEACIGIKGFKAVKKLARRAGCKVSLTQKNGYPFWAHKIKKRKMLILGAFFSFLLLIIASSFVYKIEVVGNEQIATEAIMEYLEETGLKVGSNRHFIDLREIESELLLEFHEMAWVGIEIRGVYAKVEVVEKVMPPERLDKEAPCNVVAAKNGLIEKVIAKNGDAKVKEGDIVTEGDMLITGIVTRQHLENPMYVHAYGDVYAKTYYESTKSKPLTVINQIKTGETYKARSLRIGKLNLSLGDNDVPFEKYIEAEDNKQPTLWRNIKFPVEIKVVTYEEVYEQEETLELEAVKQLIHEEAVTELLEQIPLEAEILNTTVNFNQVGDILHGDIIIEARENIAKQVKIDIKED